MATVVMTVLVVVFAEVLPKTFALRQPDTVALRVSRPLALLTGLFAPATFALQRVISALLPDRNDDDDEGEEALRGATQHAARALGLDGCGMIRPGLRADLAVWDIKHPAELAYRIGFNPLHSRIFGGQS